MRLRAVVSDENIDRGLIESLKKKVEFYIRSDARQALEIAEQALDLSRQIQDPIASALALRSKATAVYSLGRYAESLELWEEACRIYTQSGLIADAAEVQRSMVDALMYVGRYKD